jgi:HEPN domain-containing protein
MQPNPTASLTREWLQTAAEDLALAALALTASPPLLSGALYHCQQAFEKALKAFLTWHAAPFQRTHDLTALVQLCEQLEPSFLTLANDAAQVTPYGTQFRYPPLPALPTVLEATTALAAARAAFNFTLRCLPTITHP